MLNVSSNQLAVLPPLNPVDDFNVLEELYAAGNCLKDAALTVVARLVCLGKAVVYSCCSCVCGFLYVCRCHKLRVLHLAYNEILNIPSGYVSLCIIASCSLH